VENDTSDGPWFNADFRSGEDFCQVTLCIVFPGGDGGRASWYNDVLVIRRLDKYAYMDFGGRIISYRKYYNRIVSVRYSPSLSTLPSIPTRDRYRTPFCCIPSFPINITVTVTVAVTHRSNTPHSRPTFIPGP
jgi:hypothetical protein